MSRHISSLQHPLVKHLIKLRQNHDYRYEQESVVVEGTKLVTEICMHFHPKAILTCDLDLVPRRGHTAELFTTSKAVMKKASGMIKPEGIIAEFPLPMKSSLKGMRSVLALDNINDPGNLGTLLRTALALGWEGAFLVGECCDPYNEKAIRAARGANLTFPICQGSWADLKVVIDENKLTSVVADLQGDAPESIKPKDGILLIVSNEAHGPAPEALALGKKVSIPLSGKMESLNVAAAGAILMYLLQYRGGPHAK